MEQPASTIPDEGKRFRYVLEASSVFKSCPWVFEKGVKQFLVVKICLQGTDLSPGFPTPSCAAFANRKHGPPLPDSRTLGPANS